MFQIPFRLRNSAPRVIELMKKYRDIPMDFAAACLVSLAENLRTRRILTLDRDFRIYRWARNRQFDILVEI